MKFRDFGAILQSHDFMLDRLRGSHRIYKGLVNGRTCSVVVAYHSESSDIQPGMLASMIRQSGLPKKAFR